VNSPPNRWIGLLGVAFYVGHAAYYLHAGLPQNLLWGCHIASLLIAAGWILRSPATNGVGVLWLVYGVPMWLLFLATGGEFLPTTLLTHVGGTALGLWGLRWLGLPRGTWWKATAGLVALALLTRAIAPAEDNVNLAFAVQAGWEDSFRSFAVYAALVNGGGALVFFVGELILKRFVPEPESSP
jgi:hypothetical protein